MLLTEYVSVRCVAVEMVSCSTACMCWCKSVCKQVPCHPQTCLQNFTGGANDNGSKKRTLSVWR